MRPSRRAATQGRLYRDVSNESPSRVGDPYGSFAMSSNRTICATDGFPLQSTRLRSGFGW
jgi:hypothetical protein